MATTELTIRQLADEGGTAPIAPVTVPEAVMMEDGGTLADYLNNSGSAYVKLPDGTAFAWGRIKFVATTTLGRQEATANFPLTFMAKPAVVVSWYDTENVTNFFDMVVVATNSLTTTSLSAWANRKTANYDWYACYIAVGRWK